jgi:DNA mismatch repair ATPase MutS
VERHDVMQVILQDAELRWMLRDKRLHCIPDLQAIGKKLGRSRLLI